MPPAQDSHFSQAKHQAKFRVESTKAFTCDTFFLMLIAVAQNLSKY